jgi:hypothetical protein
MSYKGTLEIYDELIAGGCTEAQARVQANQLGTTSSLLERIEKDLYWMRIIGGAMTVAFFSNGLSAWFK